MKIYFKYVLRHESLAQMTWLKASQTARGCVTGSSTENSAYSLLDISEAGGQHWVSEEQENGITTSVWACSTNYCLIWFYICKTIK